MRPSLFFERHAAYGAVFVRLAVGVHLVQGNLLNVLRPARLAECAAHLGAFGFPFPLASAVLSAYAQAACGALFVLGMGVRSAAAVMVVNFLVALFGIHLRAGASYGEVFPALFMLAGSAALVFWGAGPWSVAAWRAGRGERRRTFRRR